MEVLRKFFRSATPQRNDTECVTELHGFSQPADGGRVHSSGDWLAPRAKISDIFKDLTQTSHSQNRLITWAPRRGQGGTGSTKPLTFHAGQAQR